MENIVLTVHLIISFCLIAIVLIQRSEGGGLGIGGGGGPMGGRPTITPLGKLTWLFGVAFLITSITMTVFAARNATGGSVLDDADLSPLTPPTAPSDGLPADDVMLPPVLPGQSSDDAAPDVPADAQPTPDEAVDDTPSGNSATEAQTPEPTPTPTPTPEVPSSPAQSEAQPEPESNNTSTQDMPSRDAPKQGE